jgi:tyrosyl-tRNA synthetase
MDEFNQNRSDRAAQKTLAYETTKLVHGEAKAASVRKVTDALFGSGDFSTLIPDDIQILKAELPAVKLEDGDNLAKLLVKGSLATSSSEAGRYIAQGAVSINGERATTDTALPARGHDFLLKRGKNSFAIIEA